MNGPYDVHIPMSRPATSSAPTNHPMYGHSLYPRVVQPGQPVVLPSGRHPHYQHAAWPAPFSPSSGLGIRVTVKPEYRITPPPQLSPQIGDIPRSNFQFDFGFERKVLVEAEKESQNWSSLGLENLPSSALQRAPSSGSVGDQVVCKYIASGLNREAVALAVAHYGDNSTKVHAFSNGYTLLREMGFSSNNVAEALFMNDNDTDKALSHFLNSSS